MRNIVLFDLGNTLVYYFERHEFEAVLRQAITKIQDCLAEKYALHISTEDIWRKVEAENYESSDYRVRPLEERLTRIFQLDSLTQPCDIMALCRCFMQPIFARAQRYKDTLPTLEKLKSKGYKMAVVSNTTWGSPANLWREHLKQLGLSKYFDAIVFCRDVGWRKPAKQIFEYTLQRLDALPQQSVFVGDDPRWDIVGPESVGIYPILIDRKGLHGTLGIGQIYIRNLTELINKLSHI
ncbi:MAG: HAD family hydrolase [Candidatus Bathyarchaeia archaeon]